MNRIIIKQILIETAKSDKPIRYYQILEKTGNDINAKNHKRLNKCLTDIGKEEFQAGKPLINALVVGVNMIPGNGFYALYNQLTCNNIDIHDFQQKESIYNLIKIQSFEFYNAA